MGFHVDAIAEATRWLLRCQREELQDVALPWVPRLVAGRLLHKSKGALEAELEAAGDAVHALCTLLGEG